MGTCGDINILRGFKMTELEKLRSLVETYEMMVETLKKSVKELEDKEVTKSATVRWQPMEMSAYWTIDGDGVIHSPYWNSDNEVCLGQYDSLNVFKTKEEAEKERDIRQVWLELREFAKEWNSDALDASTISLYGIFFVLKYNNIAVILKEKFGDRLKLLDF